jgi:hypothetical protein
MSRSYSSSSPKRLHGVYRSALLYLLILDRGTRWDEWSASRSGRYLPPGKVPPPRYVLDRRLDSNHSENKLLQLTLYKKISLQSTQN